MKDFSYITSQHPQFIENLYQDYVADPASVDPELKKFFEGFDFAIGHLKPANGTAPVSGTAPSSSLDWKQEIMAYRMILGYRNKGHLLARTNPVRSRIDRGANIELSFYGFSEADLDKQFHAGELIGLGTTSLRNIYNHLEKCYASHVGWEFKYISDQKKVDWLTQEIEQKFHEPLPIAQKRRILEKLNQGVLFEKFFSARRPATITHNGLSLRIKLATAHFGRLMVRVTTMLWKPTSQGMSTPNQAWSSA